MGAGGSQEISIFQEGELEQEIKKRFPSGNIGVRDIIIRGYNKVVKSVVRPKRADYQIKNLGLASFKTPTAPIGEPPGFFVRRKDFTIKNDRELKLVCSHWQFFESEELKIPVKSPCLLYMHSNIGSRCDALRIRNIALSYGFSVFSFDFSGSGNSDGLFVTMGWNECKDLYFVLKHLEKDTSVSKICFYAHNMAVFPAIVNVACREIDTDEKLKKNIDTLPALIRRENIDVFTKPITGMVLDGAYATMQKLTEEFLLSIQEEGFKIPIPMMKVAVKMVIQSCQQQTDVDFELLRPIDFVSGCFIPALFVTGKDDKYVASHHSEELAAKYGGAAIKMQVDGDHYGRRSKAIYTETVRFLYNSLSRDTL